MTLYQYFCTYNKNTKEFLGIVQDMSGKEVFKIATPEQLEYMIETGDMKHIDDVDGLKKYLVMCDVIEKDCQILLEGTKIG